ncbi:hypothetical protein ACFWYW_57565 [Nonomuraea sp. NPDC059023]|uniref:hypothetical protein n=1 Tax=unclassified Nonomuraea TaxID=2593643 RepID=UPI0036BB2390
MSEITPEKVAAAAAWGVHGWRESLRAALWVTAEGDVLSLTTSRWEPDPADIEGGEHVRHFTAVVVEGETAPITLKRPADAELELPGGDRLGLGGTMVAARLVLDGFLLPDEAREIAAHLAALADLAEAAHAETEAGR